MSILEQRITKNKELFDTDEPQDGHFDRFQDKLQKLHKPEKSNTRRIYFSTMRIAASALIVMAVSFSLYLYNHGSSGLFAAEIDPELAEVNDYYASVTEQKLAQIEELSKSDAEAELLKESALESVGAIEAQTKELEEEYISSNKDSRVFGAIVNNYRLLAMALDKVIDNMNDIQEKKSGIL